MVYVLLTLYGIGSGPTRPLLIIMRSRYFGRKAYGAIEGTALLFEFPITLLAPVYAGWIHDKTGNYRTAFRLARVDGGPPIVVSRTGFDWDDAYNDPPYWELCLSCHDRYALIGGPTVPPGPYYSDRFATNFRSDAGVIIPDVAGTDIAGYSTSGAIDSNSHHTHLEGPPHFYDSDGDGSLDSYGTCVACHKEGSSEARQKRCRTMKKNGLPCFLLYCAGPKGS